LAGAISNGKIRVLLADDHEVFLEGLSALLAREDDLDIVGVAGNGSELLSLLSTTEADLVVTDLSMPGLNGLEAVRRIASEHPDTKVVCLIGRWRVGLCPQGQCLR
jgi:DNA-binding NarL/FixJ family response regulator